jgi:hypothetical protein
VRGYAVTAHQGLLDGESVGLDDRGRSSFRLSCCGESHGSPDVEHIYTDEHPGCQGLDNDSGHEGLHQTVIHSVEEYVRGDVHTNTVEGAFGLFKRAIIGSFHQVSQIFRYSDEYEFRYNNRKDAHLFRDTLTRLVRGSALAYEQLKA